MIVRILHEGQYRIPGADLDRINEIDNKIVATLGNGDEQQFHKLFKELLAAVREHGKPVPVDEFVESDVILPPEDESLEEARELFSGDGIIPG